MQPIGRWLFVIPEDDNNYAEYKANSVIDTDSPRRVNTHILSNCIHSIHLDSIVTVGLVLAGIEFGLLDSIEKK